MKVEMTPQEAKKLLERNTVNRPIRKSKVAEYADDMLKGNWRYTGDSIKISRDGELLDGQHRLKAILISGKTVEIEMITGLEEDIFRHLDKGVKRTITDGLSIRGFKNTHNIAAIAKILMHHESFEDKKNFTIKAREMNFELEEVEKYLDIHYDEIGYVYKQLKKTLIAKKCGSSSTFIAAVALCRRANEKKADEFIELLNKGSIVESCPVFQLKEKLVWRNYANNAKSKDKIRTEMFALTVKSFNYFVTNKTTKSFAWRNNGEYPEYTPVPKEAC